MSHDVLTPDDALSEPQEQNTQPLSEDYKSDRTQVETEKSPPKSTDKERIELPKEPLLKPYVQKENVHAQIVEDDLEEAQNRFRVDSTQTYTVAEDFKALEDIGKDKKNREKSSEGKRERDRVLRWKGITVEEMKKKRVERTILDDISGHAFGGELTFIMGSSGAGKTTLLNVLTGRNKGSLRTNGEISLNGRKMTSSGMKQLSAYVQQEDVFMASQTVSEVLHFAVKMRSPERLSKKKRKNLVESMLTTFGLKNCENTRVGSVKEKGISRGEKKRLTIACEILTDPPVLFCDEPTSGLDSFMSHQVMKCLKDLAKEGKIVICTIHQPSTWVYQMADRLVVLCLGKVAFEGRTKNKILKTQLSKDRLTLSESVSIKTKKKNECKKVEYFQVTVIVVVGPFFSSASPIFQLVSWFLGMVYLQIPINRDNLLGIKGVIFATLQMNNILYMMPSLISFWEDYAVVVREYQSNMYSPSAYFMARSFTDSLLHLFYPIIFFSIIYFMTGLPITIIGMSTFLTMCIAMSMIITSLSHAVVSLCGNATISLTVAPLISVPVMVFGGFLITVKAIPIYYKPLSYVSWYHYAFEANMIALFKDHGVIEGGFPVMKIFHLSLEIVGCNQTSIITSAMNMECSTGLKLIEDQDFDVDHFWMDFVAVGAILIFWKVFGLIAFVWRIRSTT
ncbi:Protein CBG09020 [Caenorhabditis briggsae]|uniref:Protein CBG09020 n=1 Tax=Caenorhabditis briggsae TaxID=6238 RepID=A8X801_CAEBR|nr:Protein CBG09020 [Caenorhabditis briggsae]CAP28762.2 Protein CBG09020 [Caenorhabditis briggsae]